MATLIQQRGREISPVGAACSDSEEAGEAAASAGLRLLSDEPVDGAGDKLISFVHPKDAHGVLLEFCQRLDSRE